MKLPQKVIDALKGRVGYNELPEEARTDNTWEFDDEPYYEAKDCWKPHNSRKEWLEVPVHLMPASKPVKDSAMLDRVCNWLKTNLSSYISGECDVDAVIEDLRNTLKD